MPYPNLDKTGGYTLEVSFTDPNFQAGAPAGTPKQVTYGPAAVSPNGIVSIDAAGNLEILKGGPLFVKSRLRVGRSGAAGVSNVFFWAEMSTDGGETWQIFGNSIDVHLTDSTQNDIFFDFSALRLVKGMKLRSMFARSSDSNDSGDLWPSDPSFDLQTYGVPFAPSAQVSIYINSDYLY